MIFRYTILYVEDVDATVSFYERAFGLERGFVHDAADYAELVTGQTKLAFSSRTLMQSLGKTPGIAQATSPTFELAFETDDVEGALKRALDAGATCIQEARTEEWGQTTAYVSCPNGFLIELCSPMSPLEST